MAKPYSILHISDLHRSPDDPISNAELISALVTDRDRYLHETPKILAPEAIVVSGDIVQGVQLGVANYAEALAAQYAVATEFLDELVQRFLDGDRSRVVMVPGNHDVDWNLAFQAMEPVAIEDTPRGLSSKLQAADSEFRWDWNSRTLYRIRDGSTYARRLEAFWRFFEDFYSGVPGLLNVQAGSDANLFRLCDGRIGVAAYNSCDGNDCFAFHGLIRRESIARSQLDMNDSGEVFDLRMGVWHHNIEGPPYRTDYMDVEIVRGMIGRGFRLGLYGHQHKTQVTPHRIWLPDQQTMAVVSAGSLCAGARELPTGVCRQYNILEISEDFRSVCVHLREMRVANLFSRGQLAELGGASSARLEWDPPLNPVGGSVDPPGLRRRAIINEAEYSLKMGDATHAIDLLSRLPTPPSSYERQLLLSAAVAAEQWDLILKVADVPTTIEELIQRVEASSQLKKPQDANASLDLYAKKLALPGAIESELRKRIKAQEAMRR